MIPADPNDTDIIDGIDVDHLDDRPERLEHVAIKETADDELRALPFRESRDGEPPGYVEIDVDLMEHDDVCDYVDAVTDYDRRIDFTQVAVYRAGPHTPGPLGIW